MAGIYALLGVPFQNAILVAVLFRIVYYFIPFIISLGLLPAPGKGGKSSGDVGDGAMRPKD